jgi:hypothetical protein
MNNPFKIQKFLRIVAYFSAVVVSCELLLTIYKYFNNDLIGVSFVDFFVIFVCNLVLVYCAISFNKMEYEIKDKSLVIKNFMKKDKHYLFSEIEKIEEARAWPFTYIRMFFKNNKKRNIIPLDNQKEFIQSIHRNLHKA